MPTEVVIDRRLLDSFKRRALRKYPMEYARALWGTVDGDTANVFATAPVTVEDRDEVSITFECDESSGVDVGGGLICLGSIHSRPDDSAQPSEEDLADAIEEQEIVMGICAIRKPNKRRLVSWGFYDCNGKQLELVVSE